MERDEEPDIDFEAGARRLTLEEGKKRSKPKPKAKKAAKKTSTSSVRPSSSLQDTAADDKAQYEARLAAHKAARTATKEYLPSQLFQAGEVLQHKTFGLGFIVAQCGLNKIEVLFSEGRKLLAMGLNRAPH